MRTIEIKEVTLNDGSKLNYMELVNACLKAPAPAGFTVDAMELRLKALSEFPMPTVKPGEEKPAPAVSSVEIAEDVYQEVVSCVRVFRWGVVDQAFVDFVRYIESLGQPKEDKKKK